MNNRRRKKKQLNPKELKTHTKKEVSKEIAVREEPKLGNDHTKTYAQATANQKATTKEKNADTVTKHVREENQIRIRFSFVGETNNEPKSIALKQIIYEMMQCSKAIDKSAALMTWKENDNMSNLNGDEIKLIANKLIAHYIDMPSTEKMINKGDAYYSNGM